MEKPKILVAEDETINALYIKKILTGNGYDVVGPVLSGEEAIRLNEETCPDLILMDILLGGEMDGIESVKKIKSHSKVPVIYISAQSDGDILERARATEPHGFIMKPISKHKLFSLIEKAISNCNGK
ncbi:response regulator [Spirochaetota bacterium]